MWPVQERTIMKQQLNLIIQERIEQKIFIIRGKKIMFDKDLAELYGVVTGDLIQAVKRNSRRFPEDFMYQLTEKEFLSLKSHFVISKGRGGTRKLPYAFTEHGVSMAASVLKSSIARKMNITIVRAFIALKKFALQHKNFISQLEDLRSELYDRLGRHDVSG